MCLFALAHPCMSRIEPLSVARTLSTSPAASPSSSFFALARGIGHFNPRASRTFSIVSLLRRSASCRARHGRRTLVLAELPFRGFLLGHARRREVGGDDVLIHLGGRLHGLAHGLDERRLGRQRELGRG